MMLSVVGRTLPYQRLLSILDVAPWGTPHSNLRLLPSIAQNIRVIHRQGELSDLFDAIDRGYPPAVFVQTADLAYWSPIDVWHAVVIIGYDDTNFFVNDPVFDIAPQSVSHGDLDLAWLANDSYYAVIERV